MRTRENTLVEFCGCWRKLKVLKFIIWINQSFSNKQYNREQNFKSLYGDKEPYLLEALTIRYANHLLNCDQQMFPLHWEAGRRCSHSLWDCLGSFENYDLWCILPVLILPTYQSGSDTETWGDKFIWNKTMPCH